MRVEVYRNLHSNCWSVRNARTGRVIFHANDISLMNATFVVQPAGRARVLRENRKNVHAFIKGMLLVSKLLPLEDEPIPGTQVTYNPYRYSSFVIKATEEPVTAASYVRLTDTGRAFI